MDKMNESLKELLIIVGASLIIFFAFKPLKEGEPDTIFGLGGKRDQIEKPTLSSIEMQDEDMRMAYEAMCSYIDAYNDNATPEVLHNIVDDYENNMGLTIYCNMYGDIAVCDYDGNDILVNC